MTDEAGVLNAMQIESLNKQLGIFERKTSNQIFVYITPSLNDRVMSELCQEIFTKWEIGAKGKDNGVLIGIFVNDHKFRIHTGYGLEGALPDILTKRIQDEEMAPSFKKKNYFIGILNGINKLEYYSEHEYTADDINPPKSENDYRLFWITLLVLSPFYLFNLYALIRSYYHLFTERGEQYLSGKRLKYGFLFFVLFFVPLLGALAILAIGFKTQLCPPYDSGPSRGYTSSGSGWKSSSSGSSSSSSSSSSSGGSGFSGGGGGRSGGGGSDSSW